MAEFAEVLCAGESIVPIKYQIHDFSSFSDRFVPENVLVSKPGDHQSRWTSNPNGVNEFLVFKLDSVSVLRFISFGKFVKGNPSGLREFKLYAGMEPGKMKEVLHTYLRNDEDAETINTKYIIEENNILPCRYVRIQCISSYSNNGTFTIWSVRLLGHTEPFLVKTVLEKYNQYQEILSTRICMKYLRQKRQYETLQILQKSTPALLENPILTKLHQILVINGDFHSATNIIDEAQTKGLFDEACKSLPTSTKWTKIQPMTKSEEEKPVIPRMRGGHQMCIDSELGKIYMFGGWDGSSDLGDFWRYDIKEGQWVCLSECASKEGGPSPRSCHKICFDHINKKIYFLGRYVDMESPDVDASTPRDFYCFDTVSNKWTQISQNTLAQQGPDLIYDHQMCIDCEEQKIYVFGGRLAVVSQNDTYSGLYEYDIRQNKWRLLRGDSNQPQNYVTLRSRISHSMMINQEKKKLYIYAGQRLKESLGDFIIYDLKRDTVDEITRETSRQGGPEVGYTQRCTYDSMHNTIYVLSGLMRERSHTEPPKISLWAFDLDKLSWTRLYHSATANGIDEPLPRFAHQFVHDHVNDTHYLYAGNPGEGHDLPERLDDFWTLNIIRASPDEITRKLKFKILKQKYREICISGNGLEAVQFLHNEIMPKVNHDNEKESKEFRELAKDVFVQAENPAELISQLRAELFEDISSHFPKSFQTPSANISDLAY